jgi:hypothetical protein
LIFKFKLTIPNPFLCFGIKKGKIMINEEIEMLSFQDANPNEKNPKKKLKKI